MSTLEDSHVPGWLLTDTARAVSRALAAVLTVVLACACSGTPIESQPPLPTSMPTTTPAPAAAGGDRHETVRTDSFDLAVPVGWQSEKTALGFRLLSPKGSLVTAASRVVSDGIADGVGSLERGALDAIRQSALASELEVRGELERRRLPSGVRCWSRRASSGSRFVNQYVLVGGRTVVLLTHEGPEDAEADVAVFESAFDSLDWKDDAEPPPFAADMHP